MNIVLDIKPNFEAQVMGVLQSLNQSFFNSIKVEGDSDFLKNKHYLQETLSKIDNGTTAMLSEEEFWSAIDKNLNSLE